MDDRPLYQHWFRCRSCSHRFSVKRLTADSSKIKAPHCPRRSCPGKSRQSHIPDIGMDVSAGKAPAQVGSIPVRALDTAMEMTMQDHQMTNLSDDFRPGAVTAPKLRPDLQAKADAFFAPPKKQESKRGKVDLSGLYGDRATAAQANGTPPGQRFVQDGGHAIAPILTAKPTGSSPVPAYVDVAQRKQ